MNDEKKNAGCPDEETMAAFIDMRCDEVDARRVVSHVAECASCRSGMSFVARMMADGRSGSRGAEEGEQSWIASLVGADRPGEMPADESGAWDEVRSRLDEIFARRQYWQHEKIDVLAASRAAGIIAFRSVRGEQEVGYWRAEVEMPSDPNAALGLRVLDSHEESIGKGEFTLCGLKLAVSEGRASVSLDEFRVAIRKCVDVGFRAENGVESEGRIDLRGLF